MLEPIVLPAPTVFPYLCVLCGGQKGPVVDHHRELHGGAGRVYACASCIKNDARILGLVDGKELDRRMDALKTAEAFEREKTGLIEQLGHAAAIEEGLKRELKEANERLKQMTEHAEQLEGVISKHAENARKALDLVGA